MLFSPKLIVRFSYLGKKIYSSPLSILSSLHLLKSHILTVPSSEQEANLWSIGEKLLAEIPHQLKGSAVFSLQLLIRFLFKKISRLLSNRRLNSRQECRRVAAKVKWFSFFNQSEGKFDSSSQSFLASTMRDKDNFFIESLNFGWHFRPGEIMYN